MTCMNAKLFLMMFLVVYVQDIQTSLYVYIYEPFINLKPTS
jgi:hypothetical protein